MENTHGKHETAEGGQTADADAARAGVPAAAAGSPPHFLDHLASSVTRQVEITGPSDWKHLLTGVDTLDLGLYVDWPPNWVELEQHLATLKAAAAGTDGVRWVDGPDDQCLVLPGGKRPMYAYHLQTPHFHLYLARKQQAGKYPNVYASPLAASLWLDGIGPALRRITDFIAGIGGQLLRVQVSRCDLCSDFLIPGGLSLDFLREFKVARAKDWRPFLAGEALQTFYVGGTGSPLQCRIYDKALEVARDGLKTWFLDLWKIKELQDVWRVEFQIRREILKAFGIDTFEDLVRKSGGLWENLTSSWVSLRMKDDSNATRRSVHPFWQAVQDVSRDFGSQIELRREGKRPKTAPADWYLSHSAGCLVGYAARLDLGTLEATLKVFTDAARDYWGSRNFDERYRIERIELGFDDSPAGGVS